MTEAVTTGTIEAAVTRLAGVRAPTPLLRAQALERRVGGRILLKPENLQRMGSFKLRGAYNALAAMTTESLARGVVAWSSGNHAQGVALAAQLLDVEAHIVMPEDAPPGKIDAVRRLGARIRFYDRYGEDREAIARALAASLGASLIPSYDDPRVIAGQATVGVEIMDDPLLAGAAPDQLLVCCGGGGLVAGIGLAVHARDAAVDIYAVEPSAADDTRRSLRAGERVSNASDTRSVCDALLTPTPGALTFPINQRHLADVLTVSDDEALYAVGFAYRELRLVLEPGGAVALAAALHERIELRNRTTVIVLTGGNVEDAVMHDALSRYDRSE